MIRKLRFNVVFISMFSLIAVLTALLGTINLLFYHTITTNADSILELLSKNHGTFIKIEKSLDWENDGPHPHSPELPYESRYFSVLMTKEGLILQSDTGKITAIDSQKADDYADSIFKSGKNKGWKEYYRYALFSEDENYRIIFLDCRRQIDSFKTLVKLCIGASVIGLLSVLLLIIIFSGHIIKPFEENYQKQKRFISDAGHELKTPITIIKADTAVLKEEINDEDTIEWLNDIDTQTNRLSGLIEELILLARMNEINQIERVPLNFSKIIEEELESFKKLAAAEEKVLSAKIEPELFLLGEEKYLRRLISILLDNAIKYSCKNTSIDIVLYKNNRTIVLLTENSSENLEPELVRHMFQRFYRGDSSHSNQIRGYGMGLSIAETVVQQHNGKIFAKVLSSNKIRITAVFPIVLQ